jgi:tetratricopeptide (TPR) repeat protein
VRRHRRAARPRRAVQPEAVGNYSFADARDCFIHGLLTGQRLGTCVTIPVLYVAIGRRLGYPVHLALAKGHVFARWQQDHGETVNIEATNLGLTTHPDSHYRAWPRPISDAEAADYLRPLTPDEERGLFLGTRGHCLEDNGRLDEALACYDRAAELQPRPYFFAGHALRVRARLGRQRPSGFHFTADSFSTSAGALT